VYAIRNRDRDPRGSRFPLDCICRPNFVTSRGIPRGTPAPIAQLQATHEHRQFLHVCHFDIRATSHILAASIRCMNSLEDRLCSGRPGLNRRASSDDTTRRQTDFETHGTGPGQPDPSTQSRITVCSAIRNQDVRPELPNYVVRQLQPAVRRETATLDGR
jgi:hypothetical protein